MTPEPSDSRTPPDRDLLNLILTVCDGTATAEQHGRLEKRLLVEKAALECYFEYIELHSRLVHWAKSNGRNAKSLARHEPTVFGFIGSVGESAMGFLARSAGKSILAASVVGIVLLVLVLLRSADEKRRADLEPVYVARIVGGSDCVWDGYDSTETIGRRLKRGEAVKLVAGLARIEFDAGTTAVLEGPAELVVESVRRGRLNHGQLSAKVPKTSQGFFITTQLATVRVLGTEFGVRSDDQGIGSVHVFKGVVAVVPKGGQGAPGKVQRVAADYSANIGLSSDGTSVNITVSEENVNTSKFARALPRDHGEVIFQDDMNGYQQTMATFLRDSVRASSPDVTYDQKDTSHINFDSSPWLLALEWDEDDKGVGEHCRSLVAFRELFGNHRNQIPKGSRIIFAHLVLTTTDEIYSDSAGQIDLHEILVPWREEEVTWESFGQGGKPGVHYREEVLNQFVPGEISTVYKIDVTESLRRWSTDGGNEGWMLIDKKGDRSHFESDDVFNPHRRPKLVVRYESSERPEKEPI